MADTTILITGAAGFLGSHLAEKALSLGHKVIGIDNFCTGQKKNIAVLEKLGGDRFSFVEADVCTAWAEIQNKINASWLKNLKTVFHFASPASPPHYQRLGLETMWVNSLGLSHALNFADRFGGRVVFSSTSEVYGDPQVAIQNESYRGWVNTVGPRSCYDEATRFGESLIHTHNLKHKTQHGIVRIFNTYGPRMNLNDGRVIINFLVQAMRNEDLTVYSDGLQTRSFCYVDDLIDGIWKFSNQTDHLGPMNIGNNKEFTVVETAKIVKKLFPSSSGKIVHLEALVDDPRQRLPDLALAKKVLNWEPKVPLAEGLARMKQWIELESPEREANA